VRLADVEEDTVEEETIEGDLLGVRMHRVFPD
jgi:hypothetical protein